MIDCLHTYSAHGDVTFSDSFVVYDVSNKSDSEFHPAPNRLFPLISLHLDLLDHHHL